ncbi:hypothetical protein EJB05_32138 [Eragrostis curvula]|uniref:PDZ domain-containing protein n=1 Tax=Eragrostis curvula TaxID=38414 RepID=A0A5J9UFP3_9POAL|nr:hypothetical protein EJB05_32138 [Eragrostis curvula]
MKKSSRRRKGKLQVPRELKHKGNRGGSNSDRRACWSDSEGPLSKFVKYNSEIVGGLTKERLEDFESVFRIRTSVVLLTATAEGGYMFCSGTVVDHVGSKTWILTSADLVRKPGTQLEAYEQGAIKIEVVLHNQQTVEGSLEMCNLHYNIAIVTIKSSESQIYLPAVVLSDLPERYSLQPRPVVALGRSMESKAFLMRYGVLVRESCELDCSELLVCTCDISLDFIGGPIMDSEKRFIGISFSYRETTPFLPVEVAARCLKYYKKSKTLPCLCIRGQALHTLDLYVLESIRCKFVGPPSGILVKEICDSLKEHYGGIEAGDIISQLDGVNLYSVVQFTILLLDKLDAATAMGTVNTVTLQAVVQRPEDKTTFVANLNVQKIVADECDKSFQNRLAIASNLYANVHLEKEMP